MEIIHSGASLGLSPTDNLNALSYGMDWVKSRTNMKFSVDAATPGLSGNDVFRSYYDGQYEVLYEDGDLGLNTSHDLDALVTTPGPNAYFSLESSADIYISHFDGTNTLFAGGLALVGLLDGDDIDGLVLNDEFEPGVLNPGIDTAFFSLSLPSPSTFTSAADYSLDDYIAGQPGALSPADILVTDFTGGFSLWASAAELGLSPEIEVDAIAVPEPATLFTWSLASLAMGVVLLRRRERGGAKSGERRA